METPADLVIRKFGGIRKLAGLLGHANPTTVQGWKERGIIPVKQIAAVQDAAERHGIELNANDFIPSPLPSSIDEAAA